MLSIQSWSSIIFPRKLNKLIWKWHTAVKPRLHLMLYSLELWPISAQGNVKVNSTKANTTKTTREWVLRKHPLHLISLKNAPVKTTRSNTILYHSFSYPEAEHITCSTLLLHLMRTMDGCQEQRKVGKTEHERKQTNKENLRKFTSWVISESSEQVRKPTMDMILGHFISYNRDISS